MSDRLPIRRALLSVSEKHGVADFASTLARHGAELVSTGGTAAALRGAGLEVRDVAELTGFPEMMDGRVKTLHPVVHGGLLMVRGSPAHEAEAADAGIGPIDMVVINLYPFEATVRDCAPREMIIENIDIGGPAMVRSAAKNLESVAAVTDPADYAMIAAELGEGGLTLATRRRLAGKAFQLTAAYDAAIASWFAFSTEAEAELEAPFPAVLPLSARRLAILRYGENPHQQAAVYAAPGQEGGLARAEPVQGKALSYNNLADAEAALGLISEFRDGPPAVAIIKHANPCGVAIGATPAEAHAAALACDPVSAFGGIVAFNRPLDEAAAQAVAALFTEVVIAPGADDAARAVLARKSNLRLLLLPLPDPDRPGLAIRSISGGYLLQTRDALLAQEERVVTARAPTKTEWDDLRFAWKVARHVKSNAIVFARDGATAGIGAGQMSRVDSARIAAWKARDAASAAGWSEPRTVGSAVASDAFFPFPDGIEAVAQAGATAVIHPGGSMRDGEVIAAADRLGLAMVFTSTRHFAH
ncbi:MAG: bifunctional phosphoribosylaminoimidazolecarboxamide formyltransferase/IMP cyclohydrolase [Thermaurantiacus sp.]